MTTVAEMSEREAQELDLFLSQLVDGIGPTNAAIAVGWSPAKLRRLRNDPEFLEMIDVVRERRLEGYEKVLHDLAKGGHFKALQMVLFNERSERWKDVRHINVEQHGTLDIGVVESVKMAARELLREQGVAALQPKPAAIEAAAVEVT